MTKGPPVPLPKEEINMRIRGETGVSIVFNASKLHCDDMCVAAALYEKNKPLYSIQRMNAVLYNRPLSAVVRIALPRWSLREYNGPLHKSEFDEYKRTGTIRRLLQYDSHDVFVHIESPLDEHREMERYRRMVMVVQHLHPFYAFKFDPHIPIWSTNLTGADNIKCYNDRHLILNNKPTTVVVFTRNESGPDESKNDLQQNSQHKNIHNSTTCSLLFCSPACGLRHLNRILRDANLRAAVDASHQLWSRYWFQGRDISVPRAPSVRTLLLFQGIHTIDEFRDPNAPRLQVLTAPIEEDYPFDARLEDENWVITYEQQAWSFSDTSSFPFVEHIDNPEFDIIQQQDALVHFPLKYHTVQRASTHHANTILPTYASLSHENIIPMADVSSSAEGATSASAAAAADSHNVVGTARIHFQLSILQLPAHVQTKTDKIRSLVHTSLVMPQKT